MFTRLSRQVYQAAHVSSCGKTTENTAVCTNRRPLLSTYFNCEIKIELNYIIYFAIVRLI